MLSDIISVNSNAAINPEQPQDRPETQQLIQINGTRYRVLAREYAGKSSMISLWCVFWLICMLVSTSLLITLQQELSSKYVFGCLVGSQVILAAFSLYHRKKLWRILAYSIINVTICGSIASFFLIFSFRYTYIVASAFSLAQLVLSFVYIKQRGKILLQILLLGELVILSLKADGILQWSWAQALIILLPFFIFLAAAFIFILIYTILLRLYYRQTFNSKKSSLIFLIFNLASFSLMMSIPLSWAFLNLNPIVLIILGLGVTSTNCTYLWLEHRQIALHFCLHKYQVFDSDKDMSIELIPTKIPKKHLYRLSDNWFGREMKDSTEKPTMSEFPECLVCTERRSQIVWLPCGHLSLCAPCCKDVIQNKMISCILCKQKPTHLCRLKEKDDAENKLDREMGLSNNLSNHQERVIEQYQVRIS